MACPSVRLRFFAVAGVVGDAKVPFQGDSLRNLSKGKPRPNLVQNRSSQDGLKQFKIALFWGPGGSTMGVVSHKLVIRTSQNISRFISEHAKTCFL